jgi:hypothetical protein
MSEEQEVQEEQTEAQDVAAGEVESAVKDLENLCTSMLGDCAKFDKGQKAPGTRIRKGLQKLKVDAHELRAVILGKQKAA